MADDVLGRRVQRHIDAQSKGIPPQRRGPGAVGHQQRALGVGRGRQGWHVMHFKGQRARRLDEHHAGVGLQQLADPGADQRVVVAGLDAQTRQQAIAQGPRRLVAGIAHQQVITRLQQGQQRGADRGQTRRRQQAIGSAFQCAERLFQGHGGFAAMPPIGAPRTRRSLKLGGVGKQQGRGAHHRRIDRAVARLVRPPAVGQACGGTVAGKIGHGRACSAGG